MPIGLPEFVENPEPRCPVILLCDTSGSMSGEPINALNTGLAAFQKDVYKDEIASLRVEVALVTFGPVRLAQDWHNALEVGVNELIGCSNIDSHHYSWHYGKCYWCERADNLGVDIFPGAAGKAIIPSNNSASSTQFEEIDTIYRIVAIIGTVIVGTATTVAVISTIGAIVSFVVSIPISLIDWLMGILVKAFDWLVEITKEIAR